MFRRITRHCLFWAAAALPALLAAPHTLPAQQSITGGGARPTAIFQYNMTLSGNFNNGKFYRTQLSPGVDIKYNGKPVGLDAPPLMKWKDAPEGTKSFALVMEDISVNPARDTSPDPRGKFTHWVVYNISKDARELSSAVLKATTEAVPYQGPNPPKGEKAHTYVFTLYALNTGKLTLDPSVPVTAEAMRTALQGRTIGRPAEVRVTFGY
jgi:hypothetical protein